MPLSWSLWGLGLSSGLLPRLTPHRAFLSVVQRTEVTARVSTRLPTSPEFQQCGMGDLVLGKGVEPGSPSLGVSSLSYWPTRKPLVCLPGGWQIPNLFPCGARTLGPSFLPAVGWGLLSGSRGADSSQLLGLNSVLQRC